MAAFRMKGVVRPQHAPTIRNPRIQRKTDGRASMGVGESGSMVTVTVQKNAHTLLSCQRERVGGGGLRPGVSAFGRRVARSLPLRLNTKTPIVESLHPLHPLIANKLLAHQR